MKYGRVPGHPGAARKQRIGVMEVQIDGMGHDFDRAVERLDEADRRDVRSSR